MTITSPMGTASTIAFDGDYACGRYATGDLWVLGEVVRVASVSPSWDGHTNGFSANRGYDRHNFENGGVTSDFDGAPSLPAEGYDVADGVVSFTTSVGRDTTCACGRDYYSSNTSPCPCSDGCPGCTRYPCDTGVMRETNLRFSPVVTFVGAVPDSDGDARTDDEFRPGPTGAANEKLGPFRVDMMDARIAALPRLPAADVMHEEDYDFAQLAAKFGNGCAITYTHGNVMQMIAAADCLWEAAYGNTIAVHNRVIPLRFMLDDFDADDPVHLAALAGYVQHGLDVLQHVSLGWRSRTSQEPLGNGYLGGGGGINVGHKDPAVFAYWMLGEPAELQPWAQGDYYFESDQAYHSPDGHDYIGIGFDLQDTQCPHDVGGVTEGSDIHCHHPSLDRDASCTFDGQSYSSQTMNSAPYTYLWVELAGAHAAYAHDAYLATARGWRKGGRGPGHTEYRYCGPNNVGGKTNTRSNTGYESNFGNEMWTAFAASVP